MAAAALVAALVAPATAFGHAGKTAPTATDFQARIDGLRPATAAVTAKVVDGDSRLWLRASPTAVVVVPGSAGEPLLRFDRRGVLVNVRSLTAKGDGIALRDLHPDPDLRAPPVWHRLTSGHSYLWHEHRLHALEPLARGAHATTTVGRWTVPLLIDGRPHALSGVLVYHPPGSVWSWALLACAIAVISATALAGSPRARQRLGVPAVALAVLLVWMLRIGRELYGRPDVTATNEVEIVLTSVVGLALLVGIARREPSVRRLATLLAGAGCLYEGLTMLAVLGHAVALTALPTAVARPAVAAVLGLGPGLLALALNMPGGHEERGDPSASPRPSETAAASSV